ncbi:MAG: DNA polymerase III PolC-type [Candidatus Tyloplasma litorale]|nr:MAG: DNA polymerase III PolC-type [Mycoplasmatales bacterium]
MNNFLTKIKASEDLRSKIRNGKVSALHNKIKRTIKVSFTEIEELSPKNNIELFDKTKEIISSMGYSLEFISIDTSIKKDLLNVYHNIREFILQKVNWFNLSKIILIEKNQKFIILARDLETQENLFKFIENMNLFLNWMKIIDYDLEVEFIPEEFSNQKLENVINLDQQKIVNSYEKDEVLNEEIRPNYKLINYNELDKSQTKIYYEGFVREIIKKDTKNGLSRIISFDLGYGSLSFFCSIFDRDKKNNLNFNDGDSIRIYGNYEFDEYKKMMVIKSFNLDNIQKISRKTIMQIENDKSGLSRYEFHLHTKMSTLDGVSYIKEYVEYAKAYNIKSLTITDHNSAQAFPEAYLVSKSTDLKINYGVEFDVYDDLNTKIVINENNQEILTAEYVFFDLETTSVSAKYGEIIEFGGVKYKNNKIIDKFQLFIKPKKPISEFTTSLTSITNDDVKDALDISEAIIKIKEWIGDSVLVAHNAFFDYSFLRKAYLDNNLGEIKNLVVDSMKISWILHPNSRSHRLGVLSKHEFVEYDEKAAHRADYDAEILCKIFERIIHKLLTNKNIRDFKTLNLESDKLKNYFFTKHLTIISKNQEGLKDINELVSLASINYFNTRKKTPMLPLSLFTDKSHRLLKNILIGSSCSNGFVFDMILNNDYKNLEKLIKIYDYLEIFPPTSYDNLVNNGILTKEELNNTLKNIYELGKKNNIPVIVSSNAHYAGKKDKKIRDVIISAKRVGGLYHPLYNFKNPNYEKPNAHLRSIDEIFEEFKNIFTKEEIIEITITNTKKLQSLISEQKPIKDKLYPPKIDHVEKTFKDNIENEIKKLYGDKPNQQIRDRVEREVNSIVHHGFSIIYYLSAIAVKKSMKDGYLVGSRGSVGSSIAATFSGITEVNPLKPHYRCPKCKWHEFEENNDITCGYDLPNKKCPKCKTEMIGDGHSIPFETFLGFNADKVPDIDLNFSRENQSSIHHFMKEVLGEENVFRAGTISTAAFKTAVGFVKNYEELTGNYLNKSSIDLISKKIEGIKRTTGQHPGGLIVIPNDMSIYDFTPINYPGDSADAEWKTTHFDFHSIHDNVLKLDFLGHLDPSSIRMLQNLTKVDPQSIPMNDKEVISLFTSNKALKFKENYTNEELGIIGLPEFGTKFVRDLVREAKPKSFADLVRISGLSHGTDVWTSNAQNLIKKQIATLSEVICVRDDIMSYLIEKGVDNLTSFKIMESVRKGNGLTSEWEAEMIKNNVPEWYINSCKLIKYMFPKAHATAYVIMAYRIAWYKINYPLEYYATFFSKRDVEINLKIVLKGINEMNKHIKEIKAIPRRERQKKDDDLLDTYNIIFEMYSRGIEFDNINIHKSGSLNYNIDKENNKIIPPFSILEGVGESVAKSLTKARNEKSFDSIEDFKRRCNLPKKVIKLLEQMDVFETETSSIKFTKQLSLFE